MARTPAEQLVDLLAAARRAGVTFDAAWPPAVERAIAAAPDDAAVWRHVLDATQDAWAAAYGRSSTPGAAAAAALAA